MMNASTMIYKYMRARMQYEDDEREASDEKKSVDLWWAVHKSKRKVEHPVEEWKPISGYENYAVSSHGRVMKFAMEGRPYNRKYKGKILDYKELNGYQYIRLTRDTKIQDVLVHRLVMKTFIGEDPEKPIVNHINSIKSDNHLENLEWMTQKENVMHSVETRRRRKEECEI